MTFIRKILQLKASGSSNASVAAYTGISRRIVIKYVQRAEASGRSMEALLQCSDKELHALLISSEEEEEGKDERSELERRFPRMEKELKRTGVTRQLLWREYREERPNGYSYNRFCELFAEWLAHREVSYINHYKAGDRMLVDFCGKKLPYIDGKGERREGEVFVAVLGASGMTYVEVLPSQKQEPTLRAIENAFYAFGGVPCAIVPDNIKSLVERADDHEPVLTRQMEAFALHYNTAVIPTRARKPKDKGLVENAVGIVYKRVHALLRDLPLLRLHELNDRVREMSREHNATPFQRRDYSRKEVWEEVERRALKKLPLERYEIKRVREVKVQKIGHVELSEDKHFYSVPYRYIGKKVRIIYTDRKVEVHYGHDRIAFHQRERTPYGYTTEPDHMPSHHRFVAEWNDERFLKWAEGIGPGTRAFIKDYIGSRAHPEQAYKGCVGVLSLARKHGAERLEKACSKAHQVEGYSKRTVERILEKGLEDQGEKQENVRIPEHDNIRGKDYYREP